MVPLSLRDSLFSNLRRILPPWAEPDKANITALTQGGSTRKYYRLSCGEDSAIIMDSSGLPKDFDSFITIGKKLEKAGVPVPKVYGALPEKQLVLLEDLGETTLYALIKEKAPEQAAMLYREILKVLIRMQNSWELGGIPREFDFKGIRWETDYFYKQFILRFCGMKPKNEERLFGEFDQLACKLEVAPRVFMHRDFQSQNIMIGIRGVVFLDFQGGRRGLPHYDLVSILRDPYVGLPGKIEEELLKFYMKEASGASWLDRESFHETFNRAGIQRHSQALGAFSYLSMELKKKQFIQHMAPCLAYLQQELSRCKEFPFFLNLVKKAVGLHEIKVTAKITDYGETK